MTMGPAPMIRTLLMSVRLGNFAVAPEDLSLCLTQLVLQPPEHELIEALKEGFHIVRAGTGFRVAPEAEGRTILEGQALQGAVEQRTMRRFHIRRQRGFIDRESVVLAGDHDPAAF